MSRKIAYIMGANADARAHEAIAAGARPRPEYWEFLRRNSGDLVTFRHAERSRLPLARLLLRRNLPYLSLAVVALASRARYGGFLTTGEDVGLPLALLARVTRMRTPIYIITHGSFFNSSKFRRVMLVLRGMENVQYLCLAESLRQTLIRDFGVAPSRAHGTGYYADTQFFTPTGSSSSPPVVASVGTANRDYRTLVRAMAQLGAQLKIAGDSAWFPERLDIADDRLPAYVDVRSYDYQGLRSLYAESSFVVIPLNPARHASGYSAIAEAMAMGRPVIASKTDADNDFIVDGETGYYVTPGDVDELGARMRYLLDHPEAAATMGHQARARMQNYSVEAYCEKMERVMGLRGSNNASTLR